MKTYIVRVTVQGDGYSAVMHFTERHASAWDAKRIVAGKMKAYPFKSWVMGEATEVPAKPAQQDVSGDGALGLG